jgi:hypothetical protein
MVVEDLIKYLIFLYASNSVIELRIPKSKDGPVSGYFNDFNLLAQAAAKFDGKVPGIYITLNLVNPDLLYRAKNKLRYGREAQPTTSDIDIQEYSWLPIDFDPVRPSDISSSNELMDVTGEHGKLSQHLKCKRDKARVEFNKREAIYKIVTSKNNWDNDLKAKEWVLNQLEIGNPIDIEGYTHEEIHKLFENVLKDYCRTKSLCNKQKAVEISSP